MGRVAAVVFLVLAVAGCARVEQTAASPSTRPVTAPIASTPTSGATPSPKALQAMLPARIGTTVLHTFPVGQDWLARLTSELGIRRADLQVAYASDHGAAFVQMYAIRADRLSRARLSAALAAVAYPSGEVAMSSMVIAGRTVTVIDQPATRQRLGTFYAFGIGDTLIVAEAFAETVVERAFESLPAG